MRLGLTRLYLAQRGICFLCPEPMLWPGEKQARVGKLHATREHVVPRSKKGGNGSNIVLSHKKCNEKRGNQLPTEEMLERAKAIRSAAAKITNGQVELFSRDRTVVGTYASSYNWKIDVGESKFDPKAWRKQCPRP